jgi:hypothetical protein
MTSVAITAQPATTDLFAYAAKAEQDRELAATSYDRNSPPIVEDPSETSASAPRLRVFFVAVRRDCGSIPTRLLSSGPSTYHTSPALRRAHSALPPALATDWFWWRVPAPPRRNAGLADLIDERALWHGAPETAALVGMLSPASLRDVAKARESGKRTVGTLFRRTRPSGVQAEARFDGVAGCASARGPHDRVAMGAFSTPFRHRAFGYERIEGDGAVAALSSSPVKAAAGGEKKRRPLREARMKPAIDKKQFSVETQKQLEEAEYKLRSGPLDLVIEDLRRLSTNDEMPDELVKKLRELADELDPALGTLNEVEEEFLDIFFPDDSAGVELDEADARRWEALLNEGSK